MGAMVASGMSCHAVLAIRSEEPYHNLGPMADRLAFFIFGALLEPVGHFRVQGFFDRVPNVYSAVDHSEGFIDRSIRA
jgi:hypothetical protein